MRRVLLVDDELAILLTLKAVLELNRFTVDTAASAREAGQKLNTGVYDLVITDMRMETERSGYEVIRVARSQRYEPATAILTAYPVPGSEWEAHGAQQLLVKPVGTDDLLRQIEQVMSRHEAQKLARSKEVARAAHAHAKAGERASKAG